MKFDKLPERSYHEDFEFENGDYYCECSTCGYIFIGHKRRNTCKLCQKELKEQEDNQ